VAGAVLLSGACGVALGSGGVTRWRLVWLSGGVLLLAFGAGTLRVTVPELWRGKEETREAALLGEAAGTRRPVRVAARVDSFPEARPTHQEFTVRTPAGNALSVRAERTASFAYGDHLILQGRLREPREFLAAKGITYEFFMPQIEAAHVYDRRSVRRALFFVRAYAGERLEALFPEPLGAYAKALLLGDRSGFSRELTEMFRRAGTTHIVALSGFNITLVANFFSVILLGLGVNRRASFWPVALAILTFVLLTGASASVVRAGIMGALLPLAYALGRHYDIGRALGTAAAAMLVSDPSVLRYDIGFQLSFAAILGMTTLGALLIKRFGQWDNLWGLRDLVLTTVAVEVAVLPLIIYHFGEAAALALIVNLLVLPLIALTTVLGFAALAAGTLSVALGKVVAVPAAILLSTELGIMEFFASLPLATVFFPPIGPGMLLVLYGVMALMIAGLSRRRGGIPGVITSSP
ncbi:MAG: ComEC/Rec2 family competence protein, partial [bacterium]|nr:ComEC/Rec2 family competence protein [bacterium]